MIWVFGTFISVKTVMSENGDVISMAKRGPRTSAFRAGELRQASTVHVDDVNLRSPSTVQGVGEHGSAGRKRQWRRQIRHAAARTHADEGPVRPQILPEIDGNDAAGSSAVGG